jgi:ferredoxin-NADP reductase
LAVSRGARIESTTPAGASGRVFHLALLNDELLGFVGGQYVIVDTGVDLPNGKRAKRAYSIVSNDDEQRRFRIAVKKLAGGPGSSALHALGAGATLSFSGPWGKYVALPPMEGSALVFATDTGITAAIGLVRSRAFSSLAHRARIVWYAWQERDFVPEAFVRAELGELADLLAIEPGLPVNHPERVAHAQAAALRHGLAVDFAFLSGDGAVVHPLRDALVASGLPEDHVRTESFFNSPARKAP